MGTRFTAQKSLSPHFHPFSVPWTVDRPTTRVDQNGPHEKGPGYDQPLPFRNVKQQLFTQKLPISSTCHIFLSWVKTSHFAQREWFRYGTPRSGNRLFEVKNLEQSGRGACAQHRAPGDPLDRVHGRLVPMQAMWFHVFFFTCRPPAKKRQQKY